MSRAREILEQIDDIEQVDEVAAKFIARIRHGKLQRKFVCPKFFKKKGLACMKLPAAEAKKLSKLRKKVFKRKLKMKLNRMLKKRARSMLKREIQIGKVSVDVKGGQTQGDKDAKK